MAQSPKPRRKVKSLHIRPIVEVARSAGIRKKYVESYGNHTAKLSLDLLKAIKNKKRGKYVVVTSVTPTPFGEGKTLTAIGLSMALNKLNKKSIPCVTQSPISNIFGMRGTGMGSGMCQLFPNDDANLHLTGDVHAVQSAHNLCAAYLDNSIFNGNPLDIDSEWITWKRVIDTDDRALRNITTGLGSKTDGISRKTGFEIVSSSEVMAILTLAQNMKDLRERIGKIIVAFNKKGKPITCEDIKVAGAMTALLKNAIKPNLLQTTEGTPCLVHGLSSADVALGASSVIADKIALGLSEYAIVETGFGVDLGAEKFFDIKCRQSGIKPDLAVIVCSVRSLKMHSNDFEINIEKLLPRELLRENISAIERGLSNLEKQIENIKTFGVEVVVCINRFNDDSDKEIFAIERRAKDLGAAFVAVSNVFSMGPAGGEDLARAVIEGCKTKANFRFLYPLDSAVKDKVRRIAKTIYGAKEVEFTEEANEAGALYKKLKIDNLPICMIKTHLSLSHNPKKKGRPHGFNLPIEDLQIAQGAGYIQALSENIKTMPSLPKVPRGTKINVDEEGYISNFR